MIIVSRDITTRNWSVISAPAVSAAASNGRPEMLQQLVAKPPTALAMPPLRVSCCDTGWPGVDPMRCCPAPPDAATS
jgi:hypothetical protein